MRARVFGRQVLHFEQVLTTCGGWQDAVGGLCPGIKVGHSKAEIPVKIDVTFLKVSASVIQLFGDQLVLVYTGKTRLARNLVQVIHSQITTDFMFFLLTLLVGQEEGHLVCKKTRCWFVDGDILTGALHVLYSSSCYHQFFHHP